MELKGAKVKIKTKADKSKDVKADKNVHADDNVVEKIKNEKDEDVFDIKATDQGDKNGENDTKENGKNETSVEKEIKAKAMKVKIKNEENESK